jgi:monofunctional biosynthetic peptidoglycan transglycosylase
MIRNHFFWLIKFPIIILLVFFIWFTPWVLVLHMGTLIYFPYHPNGTDRFVRLTGPISGLFSNNWAYNSEIPNFCKLAAVAAEDEKFFSHYGIDIESIQHSIKTNEKLKKFKRGGSTITQQTIKNAFLSRDKTYLRKAREIVGAILLNLTMSKNSQLNWYLNIIEFGNNIYGIESASRYYFQKSVKNLNPAQCLALVTIIPSPKKWNKSLVKKQLTSFFLKRYGRILLNIESMGMANTKDIILARRLNLWQGKIFNLPNSQVSEAQNNDPSSQDEQEEEMDSQDISNENINNH